VKSYLGKFTQWGLSAGHLERDPLANLRMAWGEPKSDGMRAFTTHELRQIWVFSQGPFDWRWDAESMRHMPTVLLLGAYASLRVNEIRTLEWDSVRLDEGPTGVLLVKAQNAKSRVRQIVPLHPSLRIHLAERYGRGLVVPKSPNDHALKAVMKNAGVPLADPYGRAANYTSLRKWFATELERAGARQRSANASCGTDARRS